VTMLAIPEPTELVAAKVGTLCASVEEWAETADDIGALRDAGHKLDALAQYLAATTTEGTNRMRAAKLRLEARVGILIGKAERGRPANGKSVTTDITRHERSDFRALAANPEAVEAAIAEGTDETPVSRRKVLAKIEEARQVRADLTAIAESITPRGVDPAVDTERARRRGALVRCCNDITATDPADWVSHQGDRFGNRQQVIDAASDAHEWLAEFLHITSQQEGGTT